MPKLYHIIFLFFILFLHQNKVEAADILCIYNTTNFVRKAWTRLSDRVELTNTIYDGINIFVDSKDDFISRNIKTMGCW